MITINSDQMKSIALEMVKTRPPENRPKISDYMKKEYNIELEQLTNYNQFMKPDIITLTFPSQRQEMVFCLKYSEFLDGYQRAD